MQTHLVGSATSVIDAGRLAKRGQALLLGAVIAAMFGGDPAVAQSAPRPKEAARQACADDVHTLCAGVLPSGGSIQKCVIEKHDQLFDACKSATLAARDMAK